MSFHSRDYWLLNKIKGRRVMAFNIKITAYGKCMEYMHYTTPVYSCSNTRVIIKLFTLRVQGHFA